VRFLGCEKLREIDERACRICVTDKKRAITAQRMDCLGCNWLSIVHDDINGKILYFVFEDFAKPDEPFRGPEMDCLQSQIFEFDQIDCNMTEASLGMKFPELLYSRV